MNKPIPSKLLKLKRWLTIPETAKHLSSICGGDVSEADILQLASYRHLKLSVNFVKETWAAPCHIVHYDETELKAATKNKIYPTELNWSEHPEEKELISLPIGENKFLNLQNKQWLSLSGLWDLPMIDGDFLEVQQKWRELTGSSEITRPNYYGTFLEDDDGIIYRLRDGFNISEYELEYRSKQNDLKRHIADNNINNENAETLFNLLAEERETYLKGKHRAKLPKDSVLVVRTNALREFEQSISENDIEKKTATKPHGNTERFAQNREQILGAALSVITQWTEQCKNSSGKFEATKIAKLIDEKSLLFWSETGEPPLSLEKMEREISKWINKTGK